MNKAAERSQYDDTCDRYAVHGGGFNRDRCSLVDLSQQRRTCEQERVLRREQQVADQCHGRYAGADGCQFVGNFRFHSADFRRASKQLPVARGERVPC